MGYLTPGYFGAIFMWGTLVQGVYLPPDLQIMIGIFQLLFFLFPLTFTLSSTCFYRYMQFQTTSSHLNRCFKIYSVYVVYAFTLFIILLISFMTTASYNFSWIISPFGLLLPIFSIILYIKCHRLKIEDFKLIKLIKTNQIGNEEQQSMLLADKSQ
jgi:hypothetical protein